MEELSKQYDPKTYETDIYAAWEENGAFQPSKKALEQKKTPYVIMLPPPNITGSLHMGHAMQDTIMDILSRYHRMLGEPVLWLPGVDHAAIATNKVIEGQLAEEGKTRWDIGREAFLQKTQEWYDKTGAEIINQMRRLGCSCDWSRSRFTMDDEYIEAVNTTFIRYYEKGYIYRGARIVNWDPKTQTTVSDLEIEYQQEKTPFYYFKYGPFEIGTARPETKFGDKYVVVHPQDERYRQYEHGQTFEAEWINGTVTATVIKDEAAEPEIGSGAMTITPWHSVADFEIAQRHNLDMEQIIDLDGKLLPVAGEFSGMPIKKARSKIVAKLEKKGLLIKVDENYQHNIALNDRGKGVLEPQVMRQWFVNMQKLKKETIDVAKNDVVEFVPTRWKEHFLTWMENVRDWNINRQIWLGHRIPVWWKAGTHGTDSEEGNFVVSVEKPDGEYAQDPDVLDTWFSSALWPFATLGWPDNTDDLQTFYPTSVLVTARDILYLWVARMIFSGLELMQGEEYGNRTQAQRIPFKEVYIYPVVLAKDGRRMSKSLGTGIDPLDLIEEYGADATRFGLMSQMSYDSQAIKFDDREIKSARNFANKMWNMARLLETISPASKQETAADIWITSRTQGVAHEVTVLIDTYKIGEAARLLYDFIWHDFADWYLEILKTGGSKEHAHTAFQDILRMLHPFMPHLTEVLWPRFGKEGLLIHAPWAKGSQEKTPEQKAAHAAIKYLQDVVNAVRSARRLLDIPEKSQVNIAFENKVENTLTDALQKLASAQTSEKKENMHPFPLASGGSVFISSEHINADSLQKARQKLGKTEKEAASRVRQLEKTLEQMHGKAPQEIYEAKEAALQQAKSQLEEIHRNTTLLQ